MVTPPHRSTGEDTEYSPYRGLPAGLKFLAVMALPLSAVAAYFTYDWLARTLSLSLEKFDILRASFSIIPLGLSLLLSLHLSDALRRREVSFRNNRVQEEIIWRWRELIASIVAALAAFYFAVTQNKSLADSQVFITVFVLVVVVYGTFAFFALFPLEAGDLAAPGPYLWRVFGLIVLPYAFASFVGVLPPAKPLPPSSPPNPCAGLTINDNNQVRQDSSNQWLVRVNGRYTYLTGWKLHAFVINSERTYFWYRYPLQTPNLTQWSTEDLYFGDTRVIYVAIVAIREPLPGTSNPGKALIDYWNAISLATKAAPPEAPAPLPSDDGMRICGEREVMR